MKSPIFFRRFDYNRELLPNKHLQSLETNVSSIEEARLKTGATIGYPGWGVIYHILLSHFHPDLNAKGQSILIETGTNQGCTSIIIAQAIVDSGIDGHLYTFELEPSNITIATRNLAQAGLTDIVTLVKGDTKETLPKTIANFSKIRFCLLDASHLFEDVMNEFETVFPYLAEDAIVIFDNTYRLAEPGEDQRVNGALHEIRRRHGGNLINFEFVSWYTPGLAIWQKTPKL